MDSFFSNSHNNNKPTTNDNNNNKLHEHKTSTSELFASAKVLAEAAKGGEQKMDKDKVADAAGDLLCAASQYGKIDENSAVGKYVHKAEEYLHNYNSSSSSPSSHSSTTNNSHSTPNTNTNPNPNTSHSSSTTTHSNSGSDGGGDHAKSGGYGDYMKMAEGLFKKH